MDFSRKSRQRVEYKSVYENPQRKYPHNVTFYKIPPTEDIKKQEFEDWALERIRVLHILEEANSKYLRLLSDNWKKFVNAELMRENLKGYLRLCTGSSGSESTTTITNAQSEAELLQARRKDYISHFILRLVYCGTEDLRAWFIMREIELFKYRFSALSTAEIKNFLEFNKLNYVPLTPEQKKKVKDGLYASTMVQSADNIESLDFYKVPFTQVPDLVRSHRCYLKGGFAYVNTHDFVSIIVVEHIDEIDYGLKQAAQFKRDVETDERIMDLLKSIQTSCTSNGYTLCNREAGVPIEDLDKLSQKSYPLCMRMCHEHVRSNHHLKYFGRMQYGLFIKGIGVTLEESLRFWREEFTQKIDEDRFKKKYEYNIKHNYGKKGSMINYTPYSCLRIMQDNIVHGSTHGCPYKTFEPNALKLKLAANGLASAHIEEIMSYVASGHYQLACGKYFQITHDSSVDIIIKNPNQYFDQSQILLGNRADKRSEDKLNSSPKAAVNDDELWTIVKTEEKANTRKADKQNRKKLNASRRAALNEDEFWNIPQTETDEEEAIKSPEEVLQTVFMDHSYFTPIGS